MTTACVPSRRPSFLSTLRTVSGPGWLLLAAIALTVAVSGAAAAAVRCPSGGCAVDPAKVSLTGIELGQAAAAIMAVVVISDEYRTGMIRVTLAAMPRVTVLAAKAAVVSAVVLAAGTVAVLGSLLTGRLILPGHGFTAAHGYPVLSLGDGPGSACSPRGPPRRWSPAGCGSGCATPEAGPAGRPRQLRPGPDSLLIMSSDLASLTGIDVPTGLLIGGEWTHGHGGRIEVIDPATEAPLTEVADATEDDARDAVSAAYAALPGWAATPPRQRAECLRRAFGLMTERGEQIARLMSAENGKSLRDARAELTYAAEFFRWYAEEAVRIDGNLAVAPAGANKILVTRQPIGVSVLVTPWNFPAAMATRKLGPALAAGCTVVLKPAGETPLTALAVAGLLAEAGVPAGVVNVVPTSRPGPVVAAMMADPRVRKLSFTGSTEVGRILLRQAADTVLSCSMELGGNAPFIVFDDADLDAAVGGALIAKMRNGGEACTAANRFYVHEAIADEFTARLVGAFGTLIMGPGLEESTDVGPLVNADTRSKVSGLVDGAAGDGGRVLLGGRAPDRRGYFYEPTVIDQVPASAHIVGTEIFGPVAPIVRFADEAQLVHWANATEYGLVCYVYTRDLRRGLRVSEALETGMVGLNRGLVSDPAAPFGGVKQSGLGREGGHDGLLEFMETKYIAAEW